MKNLFKVICLVLLSMSIMTSCEKEDLVENDTLAEENNVEDYSAAIEASLNDMVETSYSDKPSSTKAYTKLYVDWYGDQYLAANKSSYVVNADVYAAVASMILQTDLSTYDITGHWNSWNSHYTIMCNEEEGHEDEDLLGELVDEKPYGSKCELVLGITFNRATDHQGVGHKPGYYSVADCSPDAPIWIIFDWPDPSIFMHEMCHNLEAEHCSNMCVMNYYYAAAGTTSLCSGCEGDINKYLE